MQMDGKLNKRVPCEGILVAIGDISNSGASLQKVLASGEVLGRVDDACCDLFEKIAELAGSIESGVRHKKPKVLR